MTEPIHYDGDGPVTCGAGTGVLVTTLPHQVTCATCSDRIHGIFAEPVTTKES
jgi:hypothetical protein